MLAGAGGARPSAASPSGPSSAARLQAPTITAGITADITRRTHIIRRMVTAIPRTATAATPQPIMATPIHRGRITAAGAGGGGIAIAWGWGGGPPFVTAGRPRGLALGRRPFLAPKRP